MQLVKSMAPRHAGTSVLIVAGDVSDDVARTTSTISTLCERFDLVLFVPGNHDLWVQRGSDDGEDSLARLHAVLAACEAVGAYTTPVRLGRLWLVPCLAWHHQSFDTEPDIIGVPRASRLTIRDYAACRWPASAGCSRVPGGLGPAVLLDVLNETRSTAAAAAWAALRADLSGTASQQVPGSSYVPETRTRVHAGLDGCDQAGGGDGRDASSTKANVSVPAASTAAANAGAASAPGWEVISFSHFLPDLRLLPEKRFLYYPNLAKAAGSVPLQSRVRSLRPRVHVFGHTHFGWDAQLHGTRYVQAALGSPRERVRRPLSLFVGDARACDALAHRHTDATAAAASASCLPLHLYSARATLHVHAASLDEHGVPTFGGAPAAPGTCEEAVGGACATASGSQRQHAPLCQATQLQRGPHTAATAVAAGHECGGDTACPPARSPRTPAPSPRFSSASSPSSPLSAASDTSPPPPPPTEWRCPSPPGYDLTHLLLPPNDGKTGQQRRMQVVARVAEWAGELSGPYSAVWSDHYAAHVRQPECTDTPPWVRRRKQRRH